VGFICPTIAISENGQAVTGEGSGNTTQPTTATNVKIRAANLLGKVAHCLCWITIVPGIALWLYCRFSPIPTKNQCDKSPWLAALGVWKSVTKKTEVISRAPGEEGAIEDSKMVKDRQPVLSALSMEKKKEKQVGTMTDDEQELLPAIDDLSSFF
jgi:hypothetical protein